MPKRRHILVSPESHADSQIKFHEDFFREHIGQSTRTLDFGCGTLRGGIPIIAHLRTGHYTGLDIRPVAIREAMSELIENGLTNKEPRIILSSKGLKAVTNDSFDLIWCHSVLLHMTDEILWTFLSDAYRMLGDGRILATVPISQHPEDGQWFEFPVVRRGVKGYFKLAQDAGLQVKDLGDLKSFGNTLPAAYSNRMLELKRR